MTEQEIRERFDAIKHLTGAHLAAGTERNHAGIRSRAGDYAEAEIAAAKTGEDDLAKVVEIGIDLVCELFVDIHRIAAAPYKA